MNKILGWKELKSAVDKERMAGRKIVFTNGCFDLLHTGHVRYLKEAKALGDILIVALNTDRSVSKLKPGRPIITEAQRVEVVASLEAVDYVTLFDEDTPYELIKLLRPDVLAKGGDWRVEDIVGYDLVPETHSVPYIDGISTTGIIKKIKNLA